MLGHVEKSEQKEDHDLPEDHRVHHGRSLKATHTEAAENSHHSEFPSLHADPKTCLNLFPQSALLES